MKVEKTLDNRILVTLRFIGENVDPQLLTARLGIEPTETHRSGELLPKRSKYIRHTGYWGIDSPQTNDRSLKEHLEYLLDILEPKILAIKELRESGICPNFYCGVFVTHEENDTFIELDSSILGRLVEIGASLDCHVYCDEE